MAERGCIDAFGSMETHENALLEHFPLRAYPLVALVAKSSLLAGLPAVRDRDLDRVLFDVRDMPQGMEYRPEFEGNLLRIAYGLGCAVLHSLTGNNSYGDYVVARPLEPRVETNICLFFSRHAKSPAAQAFREAWIAQSNEADGSWLPTRA
jgi:hypothetical protein